MKRVIEYLIPDGKERYKTLFKRKEKVVSKELLDGLNQDEIKKLLKSGVLNNLYAVSIDFYWIDVFFIKDCKVFLYKNGLLSEEKTLDDIFSEYRHQFALDKNQLINILDIYS